MRALCDLFHVPARAVTPLLQYPQHWERTVHHRHDGALPDGNLFLRVGRLAFLHRFGSPTADDRFLLGGTDFPVGSLLSVGTDALVLAYDALHHPGRTRHSRLRQAELDGGRYGRHTTGIHYLMDTGRCLFRT